MTMQPKLKAVREATAHSYPVSDVDEMLHEIEEGYQGGGSSS
jgi:hypothetical protein